MAQDVDDSLRLVQAAEDYRIAVIERVVGSVIAIYGDDREGGGSGVIIDPSGLALTNHHVIQGAGTEGWGGLADGKLYRWSIISTDPGGDIALIQMHGRDDFPYSPLGDSDKVRVGDWAMAMGNPFVLSEDETPTVTLGIVSGVNRYQEGAGSNQLVYGNCIQIDSSINPGNSGGPLFNMSGEVIGINGRGSFEERGRVNVGLGYAISSNQIRNFIPDLLATKLCEHGTLDATFDLRGGKIVCDSLEEGCAAKRQGLALGDELLEFEDQPISTVNQYLNLICTLPENWPAKLKFRADSGAEKTIVVRLYGLPYNIPPAPDMPLPDKPTPEQKKALQRQRKMMKLMTTPAGTIRDSQLNRQNLQWLLKTWLAPEAKETPRYFVCDDELTAGGKPVGRQHLILASSGAFRVEWNESGTTTTYGFDGQAFWKQDAESVQTLSIIEAKLTPQIIQAAAIISQFQSQPFAAFGEPVLDGGDKANRRLACRVKVLDANQDWLYCWFSLTDSNGQWQARPLKIASDLDSEGSARAVLLDDWQPHEHLQFPHRRRFVSGLDEQFEMEISNVAVTPDPTVDPSAFQAPAPKTERPDGGKL